MEDALAPERAATEYRRRRRQRPERRPDRFALWAVVMGVVAMLAGVATADASAGADPTAGERYERISQEHSTQALVAATPERRDGAGR